ncbi:LysE family translocator [Cryptosporangium sp. NPDC048952]|uniref:LysE family translocator n=1 Tax=Cryptosporangium sp. NPDC048952 TaxID=3363961 RepID=UPI00371AE9BA
MPPTTNVLAFLLASFVLILVPGPSVLFVVSRALAYGRRVALATVAGNAVGSLVLAVAVALGIGVLVQASAVAYTVVKLAGAAYLVFLGVQAVRHRRALAGVFDGAGPSGRPWLQGFVVGVTNPKTAVFFAAVLPQFVDRSAGAAGAQMVVLGALFAAMALGCDAVWGLAAGAAREWFGRSRRRMELIGGAAGLTMVGLGLGLAVEGRKS